MQKINHPNAPNNKTNHAKKHLTSPEHKHKKEPTVTITVKTENRHTRHMPFSKQAHKEGPQEYTGKADDNAATPAPTRERANNTHHALDPCTAATNRRTQAPTNVAAVCVFLLQYKSTNFKTGVPQ